MTATGLRSPAYRVYHFAWELLDWLFPPVCGGCGCLGERWCPDCQSSSQPIRSATCPICGDLLSSTRLCADCAAQRPDYRALRSWGQYHGPLRQAILRLKFGRDMGLGEALSKHLIELYNNLKWDVDLVVPVPLSPARIQQRGYNQSALLARPLAYAIQKPFAPRVLIRTRDTRTQSRLSAQERRKNVQDAFKAIPESVSGKVILVIDDVTTTGSTIGACSKALSAAGASVVYAITLARSVLQVDADDQPDTHI